MCSSDLVFKHANSAGTSAASVTVQSGCVLAGAAGAEASTKLSTEKLPTSSLDEESKEDAGDGAEDESDPEVDAETPSEDTDETDDAEATRLDVRDPPLELAEYIGGRGRHAPRVHAFRAFTSPLQFPEREFAGRRRR